MNSNSNDKSGINCLAGFAYQIKVFAYNALKLNEGDIVEFETIDDVNVKIHGKNIDSKEESFRCRLQNEHNNEIIQVKRTNITPALFKKTLFNWILQRDKTPNISAFNIYAEHTYGNEDLMFSVSADELLSQALLTKSKRKDAIEVKIKNRFKSKPQEFKEAYNDIKAKYDFIGNKDIDDLLYNTAKRDFWFKEKSEVIYKQRLEMFMNTIQSNVLKAINNKESYSFSYYDLMGLYEEINDRISSNSYEPPYHLYKEKLDYVNINDSRIAHPRETRQLLACSLKTHRIIERLKQLICYKHFRTLSAENHFTIKPEEIEESTFENFNSVLDEIEGTLEDMPKKRLLETEKRQNSHAQTDVIRKGSCIYLTGENVKNQISWKDDIDDNN